MRKYLSALTIGAFLLFALGGTALALPTQHEITNANGFCANCHKPHVGAGKRMWASDLSGYPENQRGTIGPLCASCHLQGGTLVNPGTDVTQTAYSIMADPTSAASGTGSGLAVTEMGAHGLNQGTLSPPTETTTGGGILPYGNSAADTAIECTTCHDPHVTDDGTSMLLRSGMTVAVLCATCHTRNQGIAGGYHPVDVAPAASDPGHPITIGGASAGNSEFEEPWADATPLHTLGGHLMNAPVGTGGVHCGTCHAVHGIDEAQTVIFEDLLVNEQSSQTIAGLGDTHSANGGEGAEASNGLCEGCHMIDTANTWNPGGEAYSHPVSGNGNDLNVGSANLADIPVGLPYSNVTLGTAGNQPLCESCHDPHEGTDYMFRNAWTYTTICAGCHDGSAGQQTFQGHHPVGDIMEPAGQGVFVNTVIVPSGTTLGCGHCHGSPSDGSGGGAHNWGGGTNPASPVPTLRTISLSPSWRTGPTNRGANQSIECYICHTADGDITNERNSPTRFIADDALVPAEKAGAAGGTDYYEDIGDGTHFMGTLPGTPTVADTDPNWANFGGWGGTGTTLWGGSTGNEIVCESCHTLEPAFNDWGNATAGTPDDASMSLLRAAFTDGEDNGTTAGRNPFCEACHGATPGGNSHPVTGQTVTRRADDPNISPNTLVTWKSTPGLSFMDVQGTAPRTYDLGGPDRLNCDSCHQVHDANSGAGTWILETTIGEIAGVPAKNGGTLTGIPGDVNVDGGIANPDYQVLCTNCHNY